MNAPQKIPCLLLAALLTLVGFNFKANSATPPTIVCPAGVTAECTGGLTPVTFTVTAVNSSGGALPVTCVPPSGTGFRLGTSNVVCSATDTAGNTSTCSFTVLVVDTTPPRVFCPTNMILQATNGVSAIVLYIASATDPCGLRSLNCAPAPGSAFPIGITTVRCDSVDSAGNSNFCTFTVTVAAGCPVANPLSLTVAMGGTVSFQLPATDPDGDPLQYNITQAPQHGIVVVQVQTGAASYSPNAGYCGPDSFNYSVSDGKCTNRVEATVSIQVTCSNLPPVCVVHESSAVCGTVLGAAGNPSVISLNGVDACVVLDASDSTDPDGDPLTFGWSVDGKVPVALDAAQEPGGSGGTGSGSGFVTLSGNTLIIDLAFSGLSANSTASHIHGPAPRGVNAAVLYPLNAIATLGGTAGTIQGTVPLVEGTGGLTIAQQIQQFREGRWYVNIHTTAHPGGEIRGQLDAPTLTGAVATTCLEPGCHTITLTVSDGRQTCSQTLNICVVTACEAVQQCISLVDAAAIPQQRKRPLLASLNAACESFQLANYTAGVNQLQAFEAKVRAQISRTYPALAQSFFACAGQIIDSVDCVVSIHGNNGVGNGVDPQPPGNPPVNDGPGTGPGHPGQKP